MKWSDDEAIDYEGMEEQEYRDYKRQIRESRRELEEETITNDELVHNAKMKKWRTAWLGGKACAIYDCEKCHRPAPQYHFIWITDKLGVEPRLTTICKVCFMKWEKTQPSFMRENSE